MNPDPRIALQIGPIAVHWYGIIITTGMILATYLAAIEAKRRGEDPNVVWDGVLLVIGLGLIGARLYHVFSSPNDGTNSGWAYYSQNPIEILFIWKGGLGIFGAIIGGLIGILIIAWRRRLVLLRWLDIATPGLLLAQAIGRWGNFVNQELYGGPTGSPWWGVTIAPQYRINTGKIDFTDLAAYPPETRFHPTFFYESAWNFVGFILLMWIGRRFADRLRDGDIFGLYVIWYGLGRSWVELFFRPDAWTIGALPTAVWISLGLAALGVLVVLANHLILPRLRPATG
jgi:phosphatidylglycerol:prolipoprotein diacylglycerol transferase